MRMSIPGTLSCLWLVGLLLPGCETLPNGGRVQGPDRFHDTRLQYALLVNDRPALRSDFAMQTEPTVAERITAGAQLPFAAAMETALWPVSVSFRANLDAE